MVPGSDIASGERRACPDSETWDRGLRLTLLRGEALRVPKAVRRIRVLSGKAWVSVGGEDLILGDCDGLPLEGRSRDEAVVSPTGEEALFLELDRGAGRSIRL